MAERERPLPQARIGILGGTSHVITTAYYDLINAEMNARLGGADIAETIIAGMNFGNIASFIAADDWEALTGYVRGHVDRLEAAGADIVLGVSNTVHEVMRRVMEGRMARFLPITEPLIAAINEAGTERMAIFGTRTTMAGGTVMREVEAGTGATLVTPAPQEREDINRVIYGELTRGRFEPASRARFREIALRMVRDEGVEGLILGCTEIMLLIDEPDLPELVVFPTARLHTRAAVELSLELGPRPARQAGPIRARQGGVVSAGP